MGNFRKIHTIPHTAFQDSKDRGASSNWKSEGVGKTYVWNSECMGGGGVRSGISTGTDKSVFLVNAFFMDLKNKA